MSGRWLGLLCGGMLPAAFAHGQPMGTGVVFPEGRSAAALAAWVRQETGLSPDRVIAISPDLLTSVVSSTPAAGRAGPQVTIRADVIDRPSYLGSGVALYVLTVDTDCRGRAIRVGPTAVYRSRAMDAGPIRVRPGEAGWRPPTAASSLASVWRYACDKRFRGPLASGIRVAAAAGAARTEAATPAVPAASDAARAAADASAVVPGPAPGIRVQVIAAPTAASARRVLAAAGSSSQGAFPRLNGRVQRATVDGRVVYRGLFEGFEGRAEARAFCALLQRGGRDCFVRQMR